MDYKGGAPSSAPSRPSTSDYGAHVAPTYASRRNKNEVSNRKIVPKLFNVQSSDNDGNGMLVSVDMFGVITTPRPLPDEVDEEYEARKRAAKASRLPKPRRNTRLVDSRSQWMPPNTRRRPTSATVVILPELQVHSRHLS